MGILLPLTYEMHPSPVDSDVKDGNVGTSLNFHKASPKMGALFAKAGCLPCFNGDMRRISPEIICDLSPPERHLSEEIIKELKTCGIISTETTSARGGVSFNIMPDGDTMTRKPRCLPALLQNNKVRPSGSQVANNSREKAKIANTRRQEALNRKAQIGKDYELKRLAVIERREKKLLDKIRKTEEKLKKNANRNSK